MMASSICDHLKGRHDRRVVIDNQPALVALHVDKTIARGNRFGLAVFNPRERVRPRVDRHIGIDPDEWIVERHLALCESEDLFKVVANGRSVFSAGRGECAPQDCIISIEGQNCPRMLRTKGIAPRFHARNNVRLVVFSTFR